MSKLIKWSGSKDSQADAIIEKIPNDIKTYYEPFLGGGSVFLKLLEQDNNIEEFIVSDINSELIGIYRLIQYDPDKLLDAYHQHYHIFNSKDIQYRKEYFNYIRTKFNFEKTPEDLYWIMRTTTNGMPRYNKMRMFNNSCHFSRPGMSPDKVEKIVLKYNKLMNERNVITIFCHYGELTYRENGLLYLDPPYENTKGMYHRDFNNERFIQWLNSIDVKWILSYDGMVNDVKVQHIAPKHVRHEYLVSGNSSFRRVIGNSKDSIVKESVYMNF